MSEQNEREAQLRAEWVDRLAAVQEEYRRAAESWDRQRDRLSRDLVASQARVRELEAAVQELRDAHQAEVEKVGRVEALADELASSADEILAAEAAEAPDEASAAMVGIGTERAKCAVAIRTALSEPATAPGGDHG